MGDQSGRIVGKGRHLGEAIPSDSPAPPSDAQVYARARSTGRIVHAADRDLSIDIKRYREYVAAELMCPFPGCAAPQLKYMDRAEAVKGFSHLSGAAAEHTPMQLLHLNTQLYLERWVNQKYGPHLVARLEEVTENGERRADVMVKSTATGKKMALEVQLSSLAVNEYHRRTQSYQDQDIPAVWILVQKDRHKPFGYGFKVRAIHRAMIQDQIVPLLLDHRREMIGAVVSSEPGSVHPRLPKKDATTGRLTEEPFSNVFLGPDRLLHTAKIDEVLINTETHHRRLEEAAAARQRAHRAELERQRRLTAERREERERRQREAHHEAERRETERRLEQERRLQINRRQWWTDGMHAMQHRWTTSAPYQEVCHRYGEIPLLIAAEVDTDYLIPLHPQWWHYAVYRRVERDPGVTWETLLVGLEKMVQTNGYHMVKSDRDDLSTGLGGYIDTLMREQRIEAVGDGYRVIDPIPERRRGIVAKVKRALGFS